MNLSSSYVIMCYRKDRGVCVLLGGIMADRIPEKFMSVSKKILEEEPDLRRKLQQVMGKVADTIVKDKYVEGSKFEHKAGERTEGEKKQGD